MKRYTKIFLLSVVLVFVLFLVYTPSCNGENEHGTFDLTMYVSITQVNLENHTVLANIDLDITGVSSIEIGGVQQVPDTVYVTFDDINLDKTNCSLSHNLGNGTYTYSCSLQGKYWYLYSYGELYPFDLNYVAFKLYPTLSYEINNTVYGFDYPISFNVIYQQVQFSGLSKVDLENAWQIAPTIDDGQTTVSLLRGEYISQFLIVIPLLGFLALVSCSVIFTNNKNHRLQLYSSVLVFAPVFLFAIQDFIPPRSSLSVAEFLGFALILSSILAFIFSMPKQKNEKRKCLADVAMLSFSLAISYFMGLWLFGRFLGLISIEITMYILTLTFAIPIILRLINYSDYKKEQTKNMKRQFGDYNPEDFAH